VTGKLGGTFDVTGGPLYFLNNSAGKKKYEPRSKTTMDSAETTLGITNYFGLFSGRFGQTGEPTFSEVTVSTDSINIRTWTVSDSGVATVFDAFKVVRGNVPIANGGVVGRHSQALRASFSVSGTHLVVAGNVAGTPMNVSVFDVGGRRIACVNSMESTLLLRVPQLSSGIFLVKVNAGSYKCTFKLFRY
jgi:acid phosphatase type 7